jgi:hypothetical protein
MREEGTHKGEEGTHKGEEGTHKGEEGTHKGENIKKFTLNNRHFHFRYN